MPPPQATRDRDMTMAIAIDRIFLKFIWFISSLENLLVADPLVCYLKIY